MFRTVLNNVCGAFAAILQCGRPIKLNYLIAALCSEKCILGESRFTCCVVPLFSQVKLHAQCSVLSSWLCGNNWRGFHILLLHIRNQRLMRIISCTKDWVNEPLILNNYPDERKALASECPMWVTINCKCNEQSGEVQPAGMFNVCTKARWGSFVIYTYMYWFFSSVFFICFFIYPYKQCDTWERHLRLNSKCTQQNYVIFFPLISPATSLGFWESWHQSYYTISHLHVNGKIIIMVVFLKTDIAVISYSYTELYLLTIKQQKQGL